MSDLSKSTNSDESEPYSKIVPELDTALKEDLLKIPGAIEYIEKLQRTLKKLVKKIRKFKKKIAVSLVNSLKCFNPALFMSNSLLTNHRKKPMTELITVVAP